MEKTINYSSVDSIHELVENLAEAKKVILLSQGRRLFKSKIIYFNEYLQIIVLRPFEEKLGFKFYKDQAITLSNLEESVLFNSKIGKICRKNFLILNYPREITIFDQRKAFRENFKKFHFLIEFTNFSRLDIQRNNLFENGELLNISPNGIGFKCFGKTTPNVNLGEQIIFTSIGGTIIKNKLIGQVCFISERNENYEYTVGVSFSNPTDIAYIIDFLEIQSGIQDPQYKYYLEEKKFNNDNSL